VKGDVNGEMTGDVNVEVRGQLGGEVQTQPSTAVSVWDDVVGQEPAVAMLRRAVTDPGAMTHAWLFTGPPGSGRSVAAKAFAAALQCPDDGCGTCRECRTALEGTHADVDVIATEGLTLKVDLARDLVQLAARRPSTRCSRRSKNPSPGPSGSCARPRRRT